MHCCRIVDGIKNKNIKNSLGATWNASHLAVPTVRFASLETSFHAANHTIPPPPSYEGLPLCSKAVFYVFVFDSIDDSATVHNLSPGIFY